LRIKRGLLRLWVALSVLWICGVAVTTDWGRLSTSGATLSYPSLAECAKAKTEQECADALEAAGKNRFEAYGPFPAVAGIAWDEVAVRAGFALIPPVLVLALGAISVWVVRGFRQ
jgi:hypothetical protein